MSDVDFSGLLSFDRARLTSSTKSGLLEDGTVSLFWDMPAMGHSDDAVDYVRILT